MNLKTVLILTNSFPPVSNIGVRRYLSMARYLPRFGWRPYVVTPQWDRKMWDLLPEGVAAWDEESSWDSDCDIQVERAPIELRGDKRIRKIEGDKPKNNKDAEPIWKVVSASMLSTAREICEREEIDAVFSSIVPRYLSTVAHKLNLEYQVPWVADYRDLIGQFPIKDNVKIKYIRELISRKVLIYRDKKANSSAAYCVTVSDHMAEVLRSRIKVPVEVIMNGFDSRDFTAANSRVKHPNRKFTVTYGGSIYHTQDFEMFFEGLILLLIEHPEVRSSIEIKFFGQSSEYLRDRIPSELSGGIIKLMGMVTHSEMINAMVESDILLFFPLGRGLPTGKIFEYLGAGRPVLSVSGDDSLTDSILSKCNLGMIANTAEATCVNLSRCFFDWYDQGVITVEANYGEINKYSRESQAGQLAGLLDRISLVEE